MTYLMTLGAVLWFIFRRVVFGKIWWICLALAITPSLVNAQHSFTVGYLTYPYTGQYWLGDDPDSTWWWPRWETYTGAHGTYAVGGYSDGELNELRLQVYGQLTTVDVQHGGILTLTVVDWGTLNQLGQFDTYDVMLKIEPVAASYWRVEHLDGPSEGEVRFHHFSGNTNGYGQLDRSPIDDDIDEPNGWVPGHTTLADSLYIEYQQDWRLFETGSYGLGSRVVEVDQDTGNPPEEVYLSTPFIDMFENVRRDPETGEIIEEDLLDQGMQDILTEHPLETLIPIEGDEENWKLKVGITHTEAASAFNDICRLFSPGWDVYMAQVEPGEGETLDTTPLSLMGYQSNAEIVDQWFYVFEQYKSEYWHILGIVRFGGGVVLSYLALWLPFKAMKSVLKWNDLEAPLEA